MKAKSAACVALGAAIRSLRVERGGHTQESFAVYAGIDRAYYGAIERGEFNVTLTIMLKVAVGLDTTVEGALRQGKAVKWPETR